MAGVMSLQSDANQSVISAMSLACRGHPRTLAFNLQWGILLGSVGLLGSMESPGR